MKQFTYADGQIGTKEMAMCIANVIIGVGILTFPRALAKETQSFDGWMSIVIGVIAACCMAWILAKLASRFPGQTFWEYSSAIAGKPVAFLISLSIAAFFLLTVAYEMRSVGNIAKQYLFSVTPVEMIILVYLLVMQYALFGERIVLIRLNLLFLPVVLLVVVIVLLFLLRLFETENLKPFFVTDWDNIISGTKEVGFAFSGFEIVLFYGVFMKRPAKATKAALIGLLLPFLLYVAIYTFVIAIYSADVAQNLTYPTIELAKEVEIPGGFLERFESVFFTIWLMTIFTTTIVSFDVAVFTLNSIFPKTPKARLILIASPLVYLASLYPQNLAEVFAFGDFVTKLGMWTVYLFPTVLLVIAVLRGVRGNG